ncbi:peptidase A24 [Halobacteriales archaeon QS_4_69_34]|nr:MAG: peptidase A24 [Halobacteriales archaeon QS_4_69_34]
MNAPVDLLRLLAVPVFAWAAWRDLRTRRVPNHAWVPLAALGVLLLAIEAWSAWQGFAVERRLFLVRVALSLGVVAPLSYLFWRLGGFGGADAKALFVLALLVPTTPTYALPTQPPTALPLVVGTGLFSLTILTNAALLGAAYPPLLAARNALGGHLSPWMAVGRPVSVERIPRVHGRLLAGANGLERGLALDALRMYLAWRGTTLPELRADPRLRDPATLPAEPHSPGDGAIADGGSGTAMSEVPETATHGTAGVEAHTGDPNPAGESMDPWGAAAFLKDADGAYGATPAGLRAGLDLLVEREVVWITPGLPFLVPLFLGLCVALVYGDLLYGAMGALGLV